MLQSKKRQALLQTIPGVDHIIELTKEKPFFLDKPRTIIIKTIRETLEEIRLKLLDETKDFSEDLMKPHDIVERVKEKVTFHLELKLKPVVNATGIVIHTNLGRSLLSTDAIDNIVRLAGGYSNLEFDLSKGKRGSRYSVVEDILCEITGSDAAMVVNNNAGAVLLCLDTLAKGKKAIVSRGELVEIGGAFRIPDVMAKSGGILTEVGTTNRTHLRDYSNAVDSETALFLKVHTSNYQVVGFTSQVNLNELTALGKECNIPVMEDLGSGTFIDFSKYGLMKEPTVQESIKAGADIITFSGDKLLGGPQAGIILGKTSFIEAIKKNPLTRALRIDKLTLSALESTLSHYRDEKKAVDQIPTLNMLTVPLPIIEQRAAQLLEILKDINDPRIEFSSIDVVSKAGGGSLPLLDLPSKCIGVAIDGLSANKIENHLRFSRPPIIGRIENDIFLMDLRTIQDKEFKIIKDTFQKLMMGNDIR